MISSLTQHLSRLLKIPKYLPSCIESKHAIAEDISRRVPTAEVWIQSQCSPCGICGERRGAGAGFTPVHQFSPVIYNFIKAPH